MNNLHIHLQMLLEFVNLHTGSSDPEFFSSCVFIIGVVFVCVHCVFVCMVCLKRLTSIVSPLEYSLIILHQEDNTVQFIFLFIVPKEISHPTLLKYHSHIHCI